MKTLQQNNVDLIPLSRFRDNACRSGLNE